MILRLSALFIFLFLLNIVPAQAQDTYLVVPSATMEVDQLREALAMCDLDRYRKEDQKVTMVFKDGTRVELFSASKLRKAGIKFKENEINHTPFVLGNIFELKPEGYIVEEVVKMDKAELAKRRRATWKN